MRDPTPAPADTYKGRSTADEVARAVAGSRAMRGVETLRRAALAIETEFADALQNTAPLRRESVRNLLHYVAVRRHDIRGLQQELGRLGLSSLGRMEAHVLASLNAVLAALCRLNGQPIPSEAEPVPAINFDTGDALLAEQAVAMLGPAPRDRNTRIMVTMAQDAAEQPSLLIDLVDAGMNLIRINGAHDDPRIWRRMIRNLRAAEKKLDRQCKVSFDLAGPKLRTGAIAPGVAATRWHPDRDALGQVVTPARVRFGKRAANSVGADIQVEGDALDHAQAGDTIALVDTRGRARTLKVIDARKGECICAADATAYVRPGTVLQLKRGKRSLGRVKVGALEPAPGAIPLRPGDTLDIVLGEAQGRDAIRSPGGEKVSPAMVSCALPEVFRSVRVGERALFDDGKIAGVVRAVLDDRMRVEITSCVGGSAKLRSEKGINFPDSDLNLPALTAKDREDLAFAARHADMVALSFVQRPEDIEELVAELARVRASHLGIVLKIETQRAFRDLPRLLITAMRHPNIAVMVARGDLGVEVGFERLSEVQEEILWLCEAAHVPVIWATQVLESLAKGGMPSRAEVTDAAMAARAECVMLNKGPYIRATLRFLCDVLARMKSHHDKKTALLRKLSISDMPPAPKRKERRSLVPR